MLNCLFVDIRYLVVKNMLLEPVRILLLWFLHCFVKVTISNIGSTVSPKTATAKVSTTRYETSMNIGLYVSDML